LIAEAASGAYRPSRVNAPASIELGRPEYDRAVTTYRDGFARDVVDVFGSRLIRLAARLVPAGMIDLDATRISFLLERIVDRAGGHLGDPVERQPLIFRVAGSVVGDERGRLVASARAALEEQRLATRDVRLRFEDGEEQPIGR
jgi:hypothetical protein